MSDRLNLHMQVRKYKKTKKSKNHLNTFPNLKAITQLTNNKLSKNQVKRNHI